MQSNDREKKVAGGNSRPRARRPVALRLLVPDGWRLRLALAYLLAGAVWILISTLLAPLVADGREWIVELGLLILTAGFLFRLIREAGPQVGPVAVDSTEEKEQLLRKLAEHIDEVFWLADPSTGAIRYVNPAYEKIWQRPRADIIGAAAIWQGSLHPDDRDRVQAPAEASAVAGQSRHYRIVCADGSVRRIRERTFPIFDDQGAVCRIAGIGHDISGGVTDPELLELLVTERTRELRALLDRSQQITSMAQAAELDALPSMILDELTTIVEYRGATIYTADAGFLRPVASRGADPAPEPLQLSRIENQPALAALAGAEEPLLIPDVEAGGPVVRAVRDAFGPLLSSSGAWVGVPLVTPSTIGLLVADHAEAGYFTPEKTDLIVAFANQAASALESAFLYEQTRQRVAEAEGLRRVTLALMQRQTLEELLTIIGREASDLIGALGSFIYLKEGDDHLRLVYRDPLLQALAEKIPVSGTHTGRAVDSGKPAVVNEQIEYRKMTGHADPSIETLLATPLRVEDEVIGALDVINKAGGFTADNVRTLSLFADAAGLAIERELLQRKAEELAVMRERQRLARGLHDSVSQALFSLTLHAKAAQMAVDGGDRAAALESIQELRELSREATLSMRRLIFEMRPPALAAEGLVNALKLRLAAVEARAGLEAEVQVTGDIELPNPVEEELYWIASEALNNVIKHARAERITVRLERIGDDICLSVEDDGIGFEPGEGSSAGGIGVRSMSERAENIGGTLQIRRVSGGGTRVAVVTSLPQPGASDE